MMRRPVAVDLYAGAGGLSLGMEQAGFNVAVAVESDPVHALTHKFNFPDTTILCQDLSGGSVSEVAALVRDAALRSWTADNGRTRFGGIDAVVGGPPCQGFSVGGVREAEDDRNIQLLRFVDLVVEIQPKVFLLENVAGLLEPRFEGLRKEVLRRLTVDGGYQIDGFDRPVNAFDYGVPQMRRRVLLMGSRVGGPPALPNPTGQRVTVGDALDGLPNVAKYRELLRCDEVRISGDDLESLRNVRSRYAQQLIGLVANPDDLSPPREHDVSVLTNSLRTVHKPATVQRFARTKCGKVEKVSRLFRLDPDGLARTLRAGTGTDRGSHTSPRPIHPLKNRVITVREAARLHGYPDWFRFHATNWHGHRQVGNSVPPPLAAVAGRALLERLGDSPERPKKMPVQLGDPAWLWHGRLHAMTILREMAETAIS